MLIRKLKKTIVCSLLMLVTISASAQDLLASQAPVDIKMRKVDSIMWRSLIQREEKSLMNELYEDWDNSKTHYRHASELPEELTIDLRGFTMPTTSQKVTSNYGYRWNRMHAGIDVKVYIGDTIRAAFGGKVRIVKYDPKGYGKFIVIRHPNGLETYYGHLSKQLVIENQDVKSGDAIGLGGNTGRSTGSHLHFETRLCGIAINPALMFDFINQDVTDDYYVVNPKKTTVAINKATTHYHKVKKGESLTSIASTHKMTVSKLCQLNGINRNTRLRPGLILKYQ